MTIELCTVHQWSIAGSTSVRVKFTVEDRQKISPSAGEAVAAVLLVVAVAVAVVAVVVALDVQLPSMRAGCAEVLSAGTTDQTIHN